MELKIIVAVISLVIMGLAVILWAATQISGRDAAAERSIEEEQ